MTEMECYDKKAAAEGRRVPTRPRIREIAEFAKKMNINRLGMAFCSGLSDEATRAAQILENHGLDICSVVCSCGALDKTDFGLSSEFKIWDT